MQSYSMILLLYRKVEIENNDVEIKSSENLKLSAARPESTQHARQLGGT